MGKFGLSYFEIFSCICFVYFRFSLMCSKLDSCVYCLRESQHHNVIPSATNSEAVCGNASYSRR